MKPLFKCSEELNKAHIAIKNMCDASDLPALETHWQEYLYRLERSWNKYLGYKKKNTMLHGWAEEGKINALRKNDPLLSYLINARGADEHTVEAIVSKEQGTFTVSASESMAGEITVLFNDDTSANVSFNSATSVTLPVSSTKHPKSKTIVVDQPVAIDFKAARLELIEITNRGRTYHPPTSHLTESQQDVIGPINAAELGIKFYENYYRKAEEYLQT